MNEIYHPLGGNGSNREQEKRKRLLQEQKNDLKEFLATQANIQNPRLYRHWKNKELPPVSLTEVISPMKMNSTKSNESLAKPMVSETFIPQPPPLMQ